MIFENNEYDLFNYNNKKFKEIMNKWKKDAIPVAIYFVECQPFDNSNEEEKKEIKKWNLCLLNYLYEYCFLNNYKVVALYENDDLFDDICLDSYKEKFNKVIALNYDDIYRILNNKNIFSNISIIYSNNVCIETIEDGLIKFEDIREDFKEIKIRVAKGTEKLNEN